LLIKRAKSCNCFSHDRYFITIRGF
jgi:hypothetical protein